MDKKLVGGVFSNAENAEKAIRDLQDIGFTKNDISVFAKDDSQVDKIENDTRTDVDSGDDSKGSKAGKGTGIGALSGGVLGGIVGLIAEVGLLAIPGIGPIATTLAGLGTGAVGGGIVGALVGAGMPEEEAKEYEKFLKSGKIIVMVEVTPDQQDQVYSTFRTHDTENAAMYR